VWCKNLDRSFFRFVTIHALPPQLPVNFAESQSVILVWYITQNCVTYTVSNEVSLIILEHIHSNWRAFQPKIVAEI